MKKDGSSNFKTETMLKQILNLHNLVKINIGKGIERHSSDSGGS